MDMEGVTMNIVTDRGAGAAESRWGEQGADGSKDRLRGAGVMAGWRGVQESLREREDEGKCWRGGRDVWVHKRNGGEGCGVQVWKYFVCVGCNRLEGTGMEMGLHFSGQGQPLEYRCPKQQVVTAAESSSGNG